MSYFGIGQLRPITPISSLSALLAHSRCASIDFSHGTPEFRGIKILVIPDKFKGTLDAATAAEAIGRGWRRARPNDTTRSLPLTDGGDGFGEVFSGLLRAKRQVVKTIDSSGRPCETPWWWEPKSRTAVIESARVIGLAMLGCKKSPPSQLDTFGLGAVLQAAAQKHPARCLIGIGGSATNDGGFGLARALGWKFLDRDGHLIGRWTGLDSLQHLRPPQPHRKFQNLFVAVDVENPLLGPQGATRVYGPQKGLRDLAAAERCLRRLAWVVKKELGQDLARVPGAGAAGGLGFGLMAFFGAQLKPGFDLFARQAGLGRHLSWADLVITGEGKIDASTFMGKGVGRIASRCREMQIPCIGLAGIASAGSAAHGPFTHIFGLSQLTASEQARARPVYWLERLAARVAVRWQDAAGSL